MKFVPLTLGPSCLDRIIGECEAMRQLKRDIERAAASQCRVLILGETGTGKEGVARALHEHSPRRSKPLIIVNCGAIPENLIESELFGHVKGAFTGAHANRKGAFEAAHGGTIFLDEVAEMPAAAQVKLLRVLQEGVCLANGQKTTLFIFADRINPLLPAFLAAAAPCGSFLP